MSTLATRNGSTSPIAKFIERSAEDTPSELNHPIDHPHLKTGYRRVPNGFAPSAPTHLQGTHLRVRARHLRNPTTRALGPTAQPTTQWLDIPVFGQTTLDDRPAKNPDPAKGLDEPDPLKNP